MISHDLTRSHTNVKRISYVISHHGFVIQAVHYADEGLKILKRLDAEAAEKEEEDHKR